MSRVNRGDSAPNERALWFCFFHGLNVFGRGKISMLELERRRGKAFERSGLGIRFVDYYGGTGNIAILAEDALLDNLRRVVREAIPAAHAIVSPAVVEAAESAFQRWAAPPDVPGFRWTRGVSLLCEGEPEATVLPDEPSLGRFLRIQPGLVAVYRKERETDRGTLDSSNRAGGWAAVSQYIEGVVSGVWTARSFAIPWELRKKAIWKLRAGLLDAGSVPSKFRLRETPR